MVKPTTRSRLLVAVSVAQLATNVTGLAVALRRRHPYDVLWMHGQADTVARDAILRGTALSAPVSNLLAQAAMTVLVARRPSHGAARALAGLGALQVPGTSANGWCGGACAHQAGTRSSRPWPPPASAWPVRWPRSAAGRRAGTEPPGRPPRSGPIVAGAFAKGRCTAACPTSRSARARRWSCSPG